MCNLTLPSWLGRALDRPPQVDVECLRSRECRQITWDLGNFIDVVLPQILTRTNFDWIDEMAFGKQLPDKQILRSVHQKLVQKAGYGSKVNATIISGTVTLTGVLAQEHIRKQIISSMNGISGVRRVVDTMTVAPPRKRV